MNNRTKEIFDFLDYVVVRVLLLALALVGIAAVIVHAIRASF
jgi:hypothetical protein